MKSLLLYTLLIFISFQTVAQKKHRIKKPFGRTSFEGGLTFSSNGNNSVVSPSFLQYWAVDKRKQRFKFGLGARLSSSFGNEKLEYITARARLTSGRTGPAVFFEDQIVENIDTLTIEKTAIHALNLFFAMRYEFDKRFGVEFNIDLAGISFGERQEATLSYEGQTKQSNAYPTTGNLLLISDNDVGTLNSEFMFSYLHKSRLRFKIGGVFLFNEYELSNPAVYVNKQGTLIDAQRYRNKSLQLGIGLNYVFNYYLSKNFK